MYADISLAKRELVYGKLDANDIDKLHNLLQSLLLPIYGMSSMADIFSRAAEKLGWQEERTGSHLSKDKSTTPKAKLEGISQWNEIIKKLHEPFRFVTAAMVEGLQHTMYALELEKRPKTHVNEQMKNADASSDDVEASATPLRPGDPKFSKQLRSRIEGFYDRHRSTLKAYLSQEPGQGDDAHKISPLERIRNVRREDDHGNISPEHIVAHRQLFMILFVSDSTT